MMPCLAAEQGEPKQLGAARYRDWVAREAEDLLPCRPDGAENGFARADGKAVEHDPSADRFHGGSHMVVVADRNAACEPHSIAAS